MITTQDQLAYAIATGQRAVFNKASATSEGAATFHSLWKVAGLPGAGASPPARTAGSGYVPTDATAGAFPFTNPVAPAVSSLVKASGGGTVAGTLLIFDRLWACSGFDTTAAGAQAITTPGTVTRPNTTGVGTELWLEVYTAPGATGASWTVDYTNTVPTASRTATYTHPANAETVGQLLPMTLQAGDLGVSAVASLTCSISSGTAGDVGISILRRLAEIPLNPTNVAAVLDYYALGGPPVTDDACLMFAVQCTAVTTGIITGTYVIGQF